MSDTSSQGAAPAAPAKPAAPTGPVDSKSQAWVAALIVGGLVVISLGAIIAAAFVKEVSQAAFVLAGGAVGALATALNAPTGIANVIAQARKDAQP